MVQKRSDGGDNGSRAEEGDTSAHDVGEAATADACCKVSRVARKYDLESLNEELRRQREHEDATLHELADYLNTRLTAVALKKAEVDIGAEPATVRAALVEEEALSMERRDSIREAVIGSIDIDELIHDFVSHETVRRHLNDHLDISTSRSGIETREDLEDVLRASQERYRDSIVGALERAGEKGVIDGTKFRVFSTRVECEKCSKTYRLQELVDNGGCDCQESRDVTSGSNRQ